MAASFDSSTQIVDAGIDFRPLKPGRRQFMLWPVLAWKVLVPEPRARSLDVFQTAIIRLCGAGMIHIDAIAERIALDRDLVAFIVLQLQSMGLLDERGRPSRQAIRLIERDEDLVPTDTVGYVFLDALTKTLWPRFWRGSLPYAQAEMKDTRSPAILSRGDEGNPTTESAWVLWPQSSTSATPPSAHAILKAARLHRRRLVSFKLEVGEFGNAARAESGGTSAEKLVHRVRFVDRSAQSMFMVTCLFLPKDAPDASWQICDPFALGVSGELRAEVERLVRSGHHGLATRIKKLVGDAQSVDAIEFVELLREASARAQARVREQIGLGFDDLSVEVRQKLAAAEERLSAARGLFAGTRRDRAAALKHLDDCLGIAYAAIEEQLAEIVGLFADPELVAPLTNNADRNRRLLADLSRHLGFRHEDGAHSAGLFAVTASQVKGAIKYGNRGLPGCLAAALLAARDRPEHPLCRLAEVYPEALAFFERLKRMRDDTSHHTEDESALRPVEEACADLYRTFQALSRNHRGALPAAIGNAGAVEQWTAELMAQLRSQAARLVSERVAAAEDDAELRVRLIDVQQKALEIAHLQAGAAEAALVQSRLRDFVVAAALVSEAGLATLREATEPARALAELPKDKASLALKGAQAARGLGFVMLPSGQLPEELARVRPDRVRKALLGQSEPLAASLMALVFQAAHSSEHPLRRLASDHPDFLHAIARISAARGHGDTGHLTVDEVSDLTATVFRLANAMATLG